MDQHFISLMKLLKRIDNTIALRSILIFYALRIIGILILRDFLHIQMPNYIYIYIYNKKILNVYYTPYIFFTWKFLHRRKQDGFTILCHYDENSH